MRITIFGATGGTGRQAVEQAVDAGHEVTAVVRNPDRLTRDVAIVTADLDAVGTDVLAGAVRGADAVLSCLGPRSKPEAEAGVVSRGTGLVVEAMRETGTRRLVVVSAVPVGGTPSPARPDPGPPDPGDGFLIRSVLTPIVTLFFGAAYRDLARMEDAVRDSALDWTIVRPPRLLNKPLTGEYRTSATQNLRAGRSVSRADLAQFMLAAVPDPATVQRIVRIAY